MDTYRDTFGVNSAQISIFEQRDEIRFARFLQSSDGCRLKTEIRFEILGYLTNKPLKR